MRASSPRLARPAFFVAALVAHAALALPALAQPDPFELRPEFLTQAAFSCGDVTVNGGGTITSAGAGGEGHVVSNGNITLNGNSTIRGNATAGPGKKIKTTGLSRVTGTKGNLSAPWPCSPVDLAPLAASLSASNDNAQVPLTNKGRNPLSGSSPPDLTLNGNETLVLPAGSYYLRNVTINGGSALSVSGDVRILATGTLTVNGTSTVNATGSPSGLRFFTSGTSVTVNGGSALKGFVYASLSTASVTLDGGGSLTGGLYGGRLTLNGRAWLTRDLASAPPPDPLFLTLTESGQPLLEGATFRRAVTPVVTAAGGTAPVSVAATLDGAAWTSGMTITTEGAHVLVVTATDSSPTPQQVSQTRHFTIDTQAPTIHVSSPPAGAVLAASPVVLTGTVTGASELTLFGAAIAIGPEGTFSATVPLAEGSNFLHLHARDAAGNEATLTHLVVLDTLPPVLTLQSPASGACVAAGSALAVSGRYADAHPRAPGAPEGPAVSVTLTLPSGAATTLSAAVDPLGAFTLSFPLPEGAEGSATLLVTAADALGHAARALSTVRVDATVPEVLLTLDGAPFPGSAPGEAPPAGTTPTLFSRSVSPRATVRDGAAAPPTATLTLDGQPYVDGTPITAEGTHLFVARASDCAGHVAVVHALFALDITPPSLLSTTPADGALLKDPVTSFSGTASPDVVTVRLAGQDVTPGAPGAESVPFSLTPFPWREGENSVSVELVDRAGNRATFARTFTVKTTGPLVEILLGGLPLGTGKTFFAAVTPEVRTNEPLTGPGAATLTVTLDGAPWTPGTAIAAAGSRTLTATVVDATGREATATASFTIDTTTGPALSITSPADGATLPGPTVDLSGTVSAPHPSGATVVRVNGRPATVTGTAWTLAALPLEPDAPNDLVAVAVDALGRTATAAVQVLVRSGAPQVVLISPADGARTNRRRVDLVGAVLGGAAATADGLVRAHGLTAAIDATGAFRLLDLPLAEGPNPLTVTATDSHGRTGEATLTVFSDTTPPAVSFTAAGQPLLDGAVLTAPVTVSIAVDDSGGPIPPPRILLGGAPVEATSPVTDVVISEAGGQVLSVVALDAAGNETRASRSFVVGGGDCSATDVRPVDGSTTPDAKVTLTGRCGSALRLLVRVPQPGGGAPQEYVAAIADGTFAAGDVPLPALGENALELVCEAAAGTPSTTLHRVTRLPAGGPEVSVTSPASGALVASSNVTLSGTVSDETADLFVNGVKVDAAFRAGTSFTQPTVTLTEGPNVLVAKAIDRAGRTGEARVVLQRDTQAPRVTVVWPTSGARFGKRGEAAPVADVTGAVDLASEPHLSSVVVSSPAGSVTATVDPVTGAFRADGLPLGAASGPARVTVLATDAAGHATTVEVDVLVDADVDAPALALNAPTDLSRLTASSPASLPVTGEAWAEEGATVSVNGISLDPATLAWELAAADGRRRVAFATEVAVPAQDGPFGVIVRVEDLAGRSASTRRLLVRDTVAPSVVEIVPAAGATEVDPNGMVLVLFSEELSGPSLTAAGGFRFTRDGQSEPIVGTFTRAGSAVAFVPGAALTPGATYRVVLGAGLTDLAGNPLEPFESTFTVAPALSGTAPAFDPAPPSVLCANALELRGTAPAGSSLRATAGDVSLTATADASGRFLVSLPLLGNGFHAVSVRLVGRDGSLGPAVHALVRKDCSAPLVERAELDREAGRVTVLFSERMSPASLSLSTTPGDGASLLLSLESDPTAAPQAGTLSLDADGVTLRIDLPQAADAWWRDEAVRLTVRPPAADERGNEVTAPYVTTFFPGGGPGDLSGGFLSGEAYDDSTGRPLDGVETRLYASSASLPGVVELPDAPSAVSTTDVRGRYGFFGDVAAGRYVLHLGKSGYTPTLRRLPLAPGSGAVPFDARLTPLSEPSAERLDPAVGGSFEGGAGPAGSGGAGSDGGGTGGTGATGTSGGTGLLLEVAPSPFAPGVPVPPGSLAVRLTPLSAQALPELLPLGWSPLSAADVMLETEGAPSASPSPLPQSARFAPAAVHLTLPLPIHTPPTAALVAVRHDVASGRWLTLGEMDRRAGSGNTDVARIALFSPGAVAVVLADTDPEVAPRTLPPGEGQFLTASILPSPLPALTATLTLDPPVVGPTGRATARVVARSADSVTVWPSGLAVQAWLDEKLVLSGGGELYEAPYTADLVLSHHPVSPEEEAGATPGTFGALTFAVSPSPKASEVLLESGHENVRLYPFPDSLERGSVLGGFGGTVASADGVELTLPEGALAESVAVEATLLTEAELAALTPPAGYDLLAAVRVGFSGRTLARAATLSVPLPEGAPEDPALEARLLLAQLVLQPADGRGAFARLTARATRTTPTGSTPHALCVPEPPGSPLPLEGLLVEGTYLVLRAHAPLGFATGFVRIGSGNGLADSRVSVAASTTPFLGTADLSRPGGRYAIPVPAGADRDVVARHPRLDEAATARIASLAPSAVVALDLLVQPVGPRVASVQPLDGATDQPITSPLVVRFSEPIDPASVVPGLLTAELLAEDGSATGAFFHGALALQADGATLVFTPTHPFPPGRRIRGRLTSGVRDAGGTPYEGPIPYLWSFTTSTQVQTGGQIDLTKIRILLPENGTARIVGSAGAIPTVAAGQSPWSVSPSVENARLTAPCDTTSTPVDTTGAFSVLAGCASTPVSLSSRVFLKVLDPAGNLTVLPLGPYVTVDGLGFVPTPGRTTVYTTPEGVEVTVPAGAFETARVVRVAMRDPSSIGVSAPAGMRFGASVDVDFDGTAKQTLRLRIPAPSDARVGSLVFAGTPVDVVWGRGLKLLDLGSIVDGGNGTRLISTYEEDQPDDPTPGTNLLQSTGAVRKLDTQLPRNLIKTTYLEFVSRANGVFLLESGAQLSAMVVDPGPAGIASQFWVIYNLYADQLLYYPLAFNWSGKAILPVVVGSPIELVRRDVSTGWILAQQQFDPYQSGGGSYGGTLTMESDGVAPRLVGARPFVFNRFNAESAPDAQDSCLRLSLELLGCTTAAGQAKVTNAADFSFSKDTRVDLFNPSAGYTRAGPVIDASQPFSLTLAAKQGEEIVAIVSPGDVDPEALTSIVFEFDRVPTNATDRETLMVLTDCGEAERFSCGGGTIPLVTDVDGSSVIGWLNGSLSAGHRYRVTLDTAQLKGSGNEGKAYVGPSEFYFVTRSVLGHSIGSSGSSILGNDPARDLMKIGGLLLVGSSSGKLVAVDVSSPESPVLWARSTGAADQIRGFATDGHGRLFFNALHGASWGVEAVRIEDVRNGRMTGTFAPVPGGVKTAFAIGATSGLLASEYTALAGSLPAGIPTAMDLLVEDEKSDPAELKDFYETHLGNDTFKDLAPDSSGVYTFGIPLDLNANGRRVPVESACSGENAWYHYQRATIANLATGETWSFDVENPWPGGTGDGTLGAGATGVIRARRGDLLEVRYNLRTYGYVAIVGSGITVVDLNRMYRTVLTGGEMQTNKGECGRRLAKYEGAELNLGSGNQGGVNAGIASTTAVVVLGTTGLGTAEEPVRGPPNVDVFSPLLFHGAVHSRSPAAQPGQISAEALNLVALFPGARLRDVAVAPDVPYWVNGEQRHRDLAFYTLGSRGVAVIDVSMRSLNLIGRFCVEGHEAWHVQYDGTRNRLFVGGTDAEGSVIDVFDVSRADGNPRADGTDPRLLSTIRAPWDTNHIAIDESGNGLLYSWDNRGGTSGSVSIPVDDPQFVFVGLYRNEGDEDPETRSAVTRVVGTSDAFLVPLGVPTRSQASDDSNEDKRVKDERKATPLFRVRVALPGGLGETVSARVQTLRALPDLRNLGKESIGAAVALPGGPGWPERDVPITLRKLSKGSASEVDPNGRTSVAFSLYESVETIALLSDPRARKGYQLQVGDGKADEQSQCRRCQRPSFTPDSDVVELLAGGRWARAFLTGTSAGFFDSQGDNYRAPSGAVELVGWADEVPSPAQVSLVEPPQNPAVWEAEAGASVALTAGEALLETTDLSVKGRGVGFAFDRTYRSGMLGYSPMGAAPWFSSLFAHLRFIPLVGEEGDRTLIEYHDGNGHVFPFVTAGNAACPEGLEKADELCVPKGLYVVLESLGDRGYRLLGRSHDARYFNVRGDLVALSDRFRQDEADPTKQGSTLQFIRDGFGQLVAIEDDLGRGYRLTYVESPDSPKYGLLATLTDFDSRRLTYNFDGIRRLESVELPEVEAGLPVVSYGYSSALIAPTAPHHGEDFSPLKLESFTLPGSVTPRVRFDYDGASARVRFVGVAEVVNGWEIGPSGSAVPPTTVTVTAPQGLVSQYTLVNGRTTSLSHLNLEVARGAPPVERSVTTRIEYHPSGDGRIKSVVRGDGGRSTFVYPDEGGERVHRSKHLNVVSIDDQGGEAGNVVTEFPAYNVDNIPESVIDGEGREIRSAVPEPNGRKSSAFVAEGVISESAFDAFGRLKSVKSGIAAEETTLDLVFHKDKRGRPDAGYVETVFQGSLWEKYEYDNRGNVTSWKTSHGTGATAGYDAWDRPVEVTTGLSTGISKPVPATVKRSYYLNGLLEREERSQKQQDGTSRLVTTSYFYNDRQQVRFIERDGLAAETAGGPAVAKGRTEFRYNPGTGLLKDVISPAGIVTHYEYDTAGRLKSEKTGDSLARTRGYDELWRPSYEHDGDEAEWTGSYDKLGRLTAESYPTGASASRTFDKAGRLSTQTISGQGDPSGVLSSIVAHVTSFGAVGLVKEMQSEGAILEVVRSFDTNGRLARQTSSGRLDAELEYETGTGRLLSLTDSTSQTVLRYGDDSSPWPDQVDFYETPSGASCGAPESTTTSYLERDALGAVTLETSNDGTQTTVDYDEEGRPLSVASSAGPTSTFAWDSRGALISATRPEGRGTTRYGYDLDGRIRAKSAIASTGQTFDVSYGYDASGRLWHVQRAGQPIETFEYYPDGVVSKYTRRDGAVVSYEYDAANRMISATPSAAPGGIGSLVVDGGQSYVWDALSRLLSTQRLTGSGIDPRTSVAYGAFDQAGRPRDEIVGTRNALTRTYDVFGRTVNLGLPLGVGAHQALDYLRQYEGCSKRLLTLTSPNGPAALGATWAWAGDGRLLGITTNGPLKTAHRFGYIGGPGAQPGDSGDGSSGKWRLGTLTVGGAGTTDAAMAPPLGDGDSTVWGQFQFGYRHRDNAKLGRLVTSPGTSSILSSQGWAWGIDAASRLTSATAGKGTLTGITAGATANAVERFQYDYGMADQVVRLAREVSTEDVEQVAGTDGRPLSRTVDGEPPGSEFAYDGAGRRVEDDRFTYRWHWFGKLAEVLVKESWPPRTPGGVPVVSPHAGHLIKWEYDALGRTFGRTHLGRLPEGSTDDCTRPFIERREFLWEGGNLLGEAGYAAGPDGACSETIGAIRWRKSYVPGAAGLDDQVQVRVESYGAGSEVASDKLYSYLRDDMNSILSLVEERVGGDAAKPQVPLRFLYTPYGEAHAETGPEVRKTRFDPSLSSLGVQNQVVGDTNHVPGGMTIDFSVPIDLGTLPGGAIVERRITDGTWGALTAEELALGRGTEPERLVLLPLAGWQLGTTYRVRLTAQLKDDAGRSVTAPPTLEFPLPEPVAEGQIGSYSVSYERVFAVEYESAFAAAETAGGAFPGGQNLGWQGHWVDPVTGLDMVRARVYDPRTASWLSEDPLEDVDSPNLYGYVAGRPHEATDPWGLESIFSGLSRKAARDAGRAGARIAGRRAAVLVAEEAAASRVERQIAGRATTSIAKGAAVSGGLRVASGIALGATILGNLAQLVPANDASSPAPSAEDEAAPNDQQIKAESDRLRQALLSQTRNVPSSPVPAAGAGGDGGGDRGCGSGENPREILQTLTDEIVSDFAADPNRVLAMLMPEEIKKGTDPRIARMNFGKAVERRLRDRVAQDPVYGQMFQHVGGANQPDFVGKPGCETFGKMYEVTTATSRSVRDHLGRPYGPGLEFVLYDRP